MLRYEAKERDDDDDDDDDDDERCVRRNSRSRQMIIATRTLAARHAHRLASIRLFL